MMKTCGSASSFFAVAASALQTRPDRRAWGETLLLSGVLLLVGGYVGTETGLFKIGFTHAWPTFMVVALVAIVVPALAEELVFRLGLPYLLNRFLPPHVGEVTGQRPVEGGLSLGLFVLWHPVQVWLGLPMAQPMFLEPAFLGIAALLGLACAIMVARTGSIWPAVFIHWLIVIAWKGATLPA